MAIGKLYEFFGGIHMTGELGTASDDLAAPAATDQELSEIGIAIQTLQDKGWLASA